MMRLSMSALEHHRAGIAFREAFSFSERQIRELLPVLKEKSGAEGVVLLRTCGRTELYLAGETVLSAAELLCRAANVENCSSDVFLELEDEDALRHLMEVACGLRSQILCEDQIITQVNDAAALSREMGCQTPSLESAFRLAVTAAKKAKTEVTVRAVPHSSAERAVEILKEKLNGLDGKSVLVIGSGEMGRLCASLLCEAGCRTTITLRTYRHGESVVPFGCEVIPYDRRTELLEHCDAVVSATASPHYTLTSAMFEGLSSLPQLLVDLALPRDIDPDLERMLPCLNIDHIVTPFERQNENVEAIARIRDIIGEQMERYRQWSSYRKENRPSGGKSAAECGGYMPLFLPAAGRRALVIGAGKIAARRTATLLRFGLCVTVIAPEVCEDIDILEKEGRVAVLRRKAEPEDVTADLFLAVAATSDRACNRMIGEAAKRSGVPVSVADRKEESTFYFPAIAEGGGVIAGLISVGGSDHRLAAKQAKRLRETLELPLEE